MHVNGYLFDSWKAKKLVCQCEVVQEHKKLLSETDKQLVVDYIWKDH